MRRHLRVLGITLGAALLFLVVTRQLGCGRMYSANGAYRAQVDAFLSGRLALSHAPDALAHDLAWAEGGVQHVWGLGVPAWQTPFELLARAIGQGPFPDRIALAVWLALAWWVLWRALVRRDEPWWVGAGSAVIAALLPGFVAMMRGRCTVYEEAAAYAYTAALVLMAGTIAFARAPTRRRYLLLLAVAGATGLIRPTVWFYGLATAVVATAVFLRAERRRALPAIAIGAALFCAGGAALYATNAARFGSGAEFGHRLNIESLPGNVRATRFSYPFQRVGWIEGTEELIGATFGRPEQAGNRGFYGEHLHPMESSAARWREYYFTTFSWPYLPLILAGLVLGALAWKQRREERWLALWAVLGAGPLAVFYIHSPSMSSRYTLDLAPAIVALLIIAWRAAAARGKWSAAVLGALWLAAVLTGKSRPHVADDVVDRDAAITTRDAMSRPVEQLHQFPDHYEVGNLDAPHLYINGSGWDATTGRVPPATHFYVDDPQFLELAIEPANAEVHAVIGSTPLLRVDGPPGVARFELPPGVTLPGLQVAFVAFGPDTDIFRPLSGVRLRSVRWR